MAPLVEPDPNKRDVAYLDQYSQERWDTVLHYLVGSSQQSGVSLDAVRILLHSGLMTTDPTDSSQHHITKAGFQFLLMETSSQVTNYLTTSFPSMDPLYPPDLDENGAVCVLYAASWICSENGLVQWKIFSAALESTSALYKNFLLQ